MAHAAGPSSALIAAIDVALEGADVPDADAPRRAPKPAPPRVELPNRPTPFECWAADKCPPAAAPRAARAESTAPRVCCHVCGRYVTAASLGFHHDKCAARWEANQANPECTTARASATGSSAAAWSAKQVSTPMRAEGMARACELMGRVLHLLDLSAGDAAPDLLTLAGL